MNPHQRLEGGANRFMTDVSTTGRVFIDAIRCKKVNHIVEIHSIESIDELFGQANEIVPSVTHGRCSYKSVAVTLAKCAAYFTFVRKVRKNSGLLLKSIKTVAIWAVPYTVSHMGDTRIH